MKKFKNLSTGLIEEVDNKAVIEQMEKYPEYYEEVKASNKGADKTEKAGKGGEKTASNKGADKTEKAGKGGEKTASNKGADKTENGENPDTPETPDEEPKAE